MTNHRFRFALMFSIIAAVFGCSGGDNDNMTNTQNVCAENWAGQRAYIIRGGCEGAAQSDTPGGGIATFSNCTLTLDVTPGPVKTAGGQWILTANLQAGTSQVVRSNTTCPGTDTGDARVVGSSLIASLRAPSNPACACTLVYTINVPRPL